MDPLNWSLDFFQDGNPVVKMETDGTYLHENASATTNVNTDTIKGGRRKNNKPGNIFKADPDIVIALNQSEENLFNMAVKSEPDMSTIENFSARINVKTVYGNDQFTCTKCHQKFRDYFKFMIHEFSQHVENWGFWCNLCSVELSDTYDLNYHVRNHESNDVIICQVDREEKRARRRKVEPTEPASEGMRTRAKRAQSGSPARVTSPPRASSPTRVTSSTRKKKRRRKDASLTCTKCGETLRNQAAYWWHVTKGVCAAASCPECPEVYDKYMDLKRHFRSKHEGKLMRCVYCFTNVEKSKLSLHYQTEHPRRKSEHIYECDFCQSTFINDKGKLAYHIKYRHLKMRAKKTMKKEIGDLLCPHCGLVVKKTLFKSHLRHHTNEFEYFYCSHCTEKFLTRDGLRNHMVKHTGIERIIKCPHCPQTFTKQFAAMKHRQEDHYDDVLKIKCEICKKGFETAKALESHKLKFGDDCLPICKVCNKQFATVRYLRKHINVHTGARPYLCTFCPAKFTRSDILRQHMAMHSDARPKVCTFCPAAFKTNHALYFHKKKEHGL